LFVQISKSWLLPALFFIFISPACLADLKASIEKITDIHLSQSDKWQSLLHLKNGQPQIVDHKFLLSKPQFSVEAEMIESIKFIYADPAQAICRFPARFLFLSQYLDFDTAQLTNTTQCPEFSKYQNFVPFDEVNLIFASEVLSSASSMMGHTFLNVSGANVKSTQVSHSLSFFTEFDSYNPFRLLYDGILGGMQGLFIVRPYAVDVEQYAQKEGRNLWSYNLNLSDFDKQLIKYHIWELKELDIEYLFQNYNCATLTLYVLSIANPALRVEEKLYVSPLDVAKAVKKHGMVKSTGVTLADDWALNMLQQEMDANLVQSVESYVFEDNPLAFDLLDEHSRLLAKEYLSLLINRPEVKQQLKSVRFAELQRVAADFDKQSLVIDLSLYKDPINTPQDSILGTSLAFVSGSTFIDLSFLPASHKIYGDNRQYFSESELKIAEVVLRADIRKRDIKLHSFTLYSVKSYIPDSDAISQVSGTFFLGYRHQLNKILLETGVVDLSGSFGKTYKIHRDVMVYGMLGFGIASNTADMFLYTEPYVGAIVNAVGDTKAIFEYRITKGQFGSDFVTHTSSFTYSWYGVDDTTLKLSFRSDSSDRIRRNELSVGFDYHF
jgi:hypothetical protein